PTELFPLGCGVTSHYFLSLRGAHYTRNVFSRNPPDEKCRSSADKITNTLKMPAENAVTVE
ncbi:hypothetical protein, partial [Dickeya solani]|uniref:hypothetical protein n=1 Tax=Dickeya solani TaxID=1089444 RepID=UPI0022A782C3